MKDLVSEAVKYGFYSDGEFYFFNDHIIPGSRGIGVFSRKCVSTASGWPAAPLLSFLPLPSLLPSKSSGLFV